MRVDGEDVSEGGVDDEALGPWNNLRMSILAGFEGVETVDDVAVDGV